MKFFRINQNAIFCTTMWGLALAGIGTQVYFFPRLPERVAIHFNALGDATGWASKTTLLIIDIGVLLFMAALFQLMLYYLPKKPEELINIPHKDYWFSPEKRELTVKRVSRYLLWFSNLTLLFLVGLFYLTAEVNYYQTFRLGNLFWLLIGLYLAAIFFLTVELMLFFFKTPRK